MIKEYRKQTGVWNVVIPSESKTAQCEKLSSQMFPNVPKWPIRRDGKCILNTDRANIALFYFPSLH